MVGQAGGLFIYSRNLYFIYLNRDSQDGAAAP